MLLYIASYAAKLLFRLLYSKHSIHLQDQKLGQDDFLELLIDQALRTSALCTSVYTQIMSSTRECFMRQISH